MSYSQTHFQVMFSHVSQKMQAATFCMWMWLGHWRWVSVPKTCLQASLQTANGSSTTILLSGHTYAKKKDVFLIHVTVLKYS